MSKTENLKPRRCVSTYDLKPNSEMSKTGRYSNDSCTSNSTVMIQNILAEMESGLSGTEVYEKLIKTFVPNKITKKNKTPNKRELQGNNETPKTSKISKRIEHTNKPKEFDGEKHLKNFKQGVQSLEKTPPSNYEFRESKPEKESEKLDSNQGISLLREDKIKQLKGKKGFDASTPKLQHLKSQDDRFKNACNNVLMEKEDWEAPRISAIQPTIDFNKTVFSEENEKTFTGYSNCTILGLDSSKKNNTVLINDTCNMEDTIIAGDLTVLSQRIEEMKEDGVCIVRSADAEEPILLTVVQKLADFPKGKK